MTTPAPTPGRSLRAAIAGSAGFTLIELLVAMSLFVGVMAAAGSILAPAQRTANNDTENATSQSESQAAIDRMIRELRQGTAVDVSNPNQMVVELNGQQVSYECDIADPKWTSYRACYRTTAAIGATLPAATASNVVISRVSNGTAANPVFTYTLPSIDTTTDSLDEASDAGNTPDPPSPVYTAVHLEFPAKGELTVGGRTRTIVFDGGFELRNINYDQTSGTGS